MRSRDIATFAGVILFGALASAEQLPVPPLELQQRAIEVASERRRLIAELRAASESALAQAAKEQAKETLGPSPVVLGLHLQAARAFEALGQLRAFEEADFLIASFDFRSRIDSSDPDRLDLRSILDSHPAAAAFAALGAPAGDLLLEKVGEGSVPSSSYPVVAAVLERLYEGGEEARNALQQHVRGVGEQSRIHLEDPVLLEALSGE